MPPNMNKKVLVNYLGADFQSVEKPKGGGIEKFFVEGGS